MARYPHPIVAREGWPFLAVAVALAAAIGIFGGWWWSAPFWLAALFVLQFFRDPPREVPADPRAVVSPADGRVVAVEKSRDPYLERDALKISVFMNVFNVHSNRAPVDGTVRKRWYHGGSFLNAALDKASSRTSATRSGSARAAGATSPACRSPAWWRAASCATPAKARSSRAAIATASSASARA